VLVAAWAGGTPAQGPITRTSAQTVRRANELTLAGLRPGIHTAADAKRLYKSLSASKDGSELTSVAFCPRQKLTIETDATNRIQSVRTDMVFSDGNCLETRTPWRTGRDLQILDSEQRVREIYGKPDSVSPSTKGGQQLELWYYAFDWAGPDVPQVMEVVCTAGKPDQPGRVVEITLAASSL